MFGLMRPEGGCSHKHSTDYRFHRMHYCGVCKAMGNTYGHKTRFLLNYDIVFLAELLSNWSGEDLTQWGGAYQAINQCFTMPKGNETPLSLQYAADAALLLSELKIEDHLADSGRFSWRFANWFYASAFMKAAKQLEKWGLDMEAVRYWAAQQAEREANMPENQAELRQYIFHCAEPTAELTALIFRQGAIAIGKTAEADAAAELGRQFGFLAYTLDAFDDVERDAFSRQFNPLLLYFKRERSLEENEREATRNLLYSIQDDIESALRQMPLSEEKILLYNSRLRSNTALQLYKERQIPLRFSERVALRWQKAQEYARQITCDAPNNLATKMRFQMLSVAVFVAPNTPEYMGMESKGAVGFTWLAFLTAFLAAIGLGIVVGKKQKPIKQKKKQKRNLKKFFQQLRSGACCNSNACTNGCSSGCGGGNCLGSCCTACCGAMACACCESCCDNNSGNCCDSCCDGDGGGAWVWIVIAFGIIVIGVTVLLIVLL